MITKHAGATKGRKSGGFIILVRKEIENIFKIVKNSNNFVWIELSKHLIKNVMENFLIVAVYVSDVSSTYYNEEIFEELNKDTLKDIYEEKGDFIPGPKGKTKFGDVPTRNNCDKTENSHGNKIINFCKTFDFIILNGRTEGDPIGNFTHLNFNNGPSTIDYALCNEKCNMLISNFLVLPMNEISDHSKIVTVFKEGIPITNETENDKYMWKERGVLYKWDKEKRHVFFNKIRNSIKEFQEIHQRIDAGLVHSAGEQIQQLFIQTARATLQGKTKKISKNWKKRKKSKKWFDSDCKILQNEVRKFGKRKHSLPHNIILREKYHEKLKEFKKICKSKKYFLLQKNLNEIDSVLGDSKSFWEKWKKIGENYNKEQNNNIPGKRLYNYFSNLHNETISDDITDTETINEIPTKEDFNKTFSKKEFKTIIQNLKTNKSEGYDCISNEMIKHSPDIMLNTIHRFINLCLDKCIVPKSWSLELISLIHKKGNINDPGNYRGIFWIPFLFPLQKVTP